MREITIRSATGRRKSVVRVALWRSLGERLNHNGDGAYVRRVARGVDGIIYETCSRRGWRVARDQAVAAKQLDAPIDLQVGGRKRIEFTRDQIEHMVFLYTNTSCSYDRVGAHFGVSAGVARLAIEKEQRRLTQEDR